MNQDKAIIKVVRSQAGTSLSAGFNSGMMNLIQHAVVKRKRRMYIGTLCLISTVSLGLISMAVYLLRDYLQENFTFQMPSLTSLLESVSKYGFGFYIAFLTIILIALDHYFRSMWQRHKTDKFRQYNT